MGELSLRISDADRDHAVVELREHLLAGRLTLEEFGERVGTALASRTAGELEHVTGDLAMPAAASLRRPARFTGGAFAHVVRRGRMRLRRGTVALSVFSDVDLDLREARVDTQTTTVRVFAVFGNVDVYVPEGVDTDVGGVAVFGHRREWGRDVAPHGAPYVRVRVIGLFATVDVWRVPPKTEGTYREIMKAVGRP